MNITGLNQNEETMASEGMAICLANTESKAHIISLNTYLGSRSGLKNEYSTLKNAGFYLPPIEFCTRRWLGSVIKGKFKLLKRDDVKSYQAKRWTELSVNTILAACNTAGAAADFQNFLPPLTTKGYTPKISRNWLLDVVNTKAPKVLSALMATVIKRHAGKAVQKNKTVEVCAEVADAVQDTAHANFFAPMSRRAKKNTKNPQATKYPIKKWDLTKQQSTGSKVPGWTK